mgnify:CR=1 FL=1
MIKNFIKRLSKSKSPLSAGVYFFKDRRGRVLYIGKAAKLKHRLSSYRRNIDPRIGQMLKTAVDLDWQETGSEIEALILESQLIKKHRPPFNIMLRDDKQYFFVGITKEKFPKIFLTHQPPGLSKSAIHPLENSRAKSRGSRVGSMADLPKVNYIGPFTEGSSLKSTLKLLKKVFPFCTCKQKHHRYCLNYHIGNCLGFCCLKNNSDRSVGAAEIKHYQKNIKAVRDVLSEKRTSVLKNIEKEMNASAKKHNFEKAIELRGKIVQLQRVFENARIIKELTGRKKVLEELKKYLRLPVLPERIEGYDISNIQGQFATGSMIVFTNGQPDKNEYRKFKIRTVSPDQGSDVAMLKEMLIRRFNHPEWQFPDLIVIDGGKGQLSTALSTVPNKTQVLALAKDNKHTGSHIYQPNKKEATPLKDLPVSVKNLILFVDSEAHRFAITYYRKLHRRNI